MQSTERTPSTFLSKRLSQFWLPLLIVLSGLVIGWTLANLQTQENNRLINDILQQRINHLANGVHDSVAVYELGLRGLRGSIIAKGVQNFDYHSMQTYTGSRNYSKEFPGARGIGYIRLVSPSDKESFAKQMAQERPDKTFNIRQLQPHPDTLFIIRNIEPESNNKQAIGLDIGSEANRREAAIGAANANAMQLTGPITLVQASNQTSQGFLILLPIYQQGQSLTPSFANVVGWTYAPLLIEEVLRAVSVQSQHLVLSISDITRGNKQEFFTRGDPKSAISAFKKEQNLSLFGREWALTLMPSPEFIASLPLKKPQQAFLNAFLISLLLAAGSFSAQLIALRRIADLQHRHDLIQAEENALQQANLELEQQVKNRTLKLTHLSALQRSILDAAAYAIIATDRDGVITEFNPSAEALLGYRRTDVVGLYTSATFLNEAEITAHLALLPQSNQPLPLGFEAIAAISRSTGNNEQCWSFVNQQGQHIPVKLSVTALHSDNGVLTGYLGVAYDLTEEITRNHELATTREAALQASKAKSDFLATMSHEIRTPMNAVLGLLQMTLYTDLNPQQLEYLKKTQAAAKSLLTLLNDILDFSKIEAGRLNLEEEPFSLQQLLTEMGSMLSAQAQNKNIELIYDVAEDVPDILIGDCLRLRQVLLNVMSNAIKFTEQGEVINRIAVQILNKEHCVLTFTISDTGIGMNAEQLEVIFKGFQQADSSISRRFGGTGLGLAICRELIDLMQGNIQVNSIVGEGSVFTITLPFTFKPATQRPQMQLPARALLIEDNKTSRLVLKEMLQQLGFDVLACTDSTDALQLMRDPMAPAVDLILVDWLLPGMDGLSFVTTLREIDTLTKQPFVVMITAFGERVLAEQRNHPLAQCDATLIKPITREMLHSTLISAIAQTDDKPMNKNDIKLCSTSDNRLTGRHLLLVEDNATNRLVATSLLRLHGAILTEAVDGFDALDKLSSQRFDLVLMDIQMPGIDGYETTRQIRQHLNLSTLPIVAMTANAMSEDKFACERAGMNGYIAKPFDIEQVIQTITPLFNPIPNDMNEELISTEYSLGIFPPQVNAYALAQGLELEKACKQIGDTDIFLLVLNQLRADIDQAQAILTRPQLSVQDARIQYHSLKSAAATCGFSSLSASMRIAEAACEEMVEPIEPDVNVLISLNNSREQLDTLSTMLEI